MSDIKDVAVCARLGQERARLGWTIDRVASLAGVSAKTVGRWEKEVPIPTDKLALLDGGGMDGLFVLSGQKKDSVVTELGVRTHFVDWFIGWWKGANDVQRIFFETEASRCWPEYAAYLADLAGKHDLAKRIREGRMQGYGQDSGA